MSLTTATKYGKVTISGDVIAKLCSRVASECYGVAALVPIHLSDSILMLFNKEPATKGIKIVTTDNRAYIDVFVVLKEGVNQDAVKESLESAISYNVEKFSGMRVKSVTAHVVGSKI